MKADNPAFEFIYEDMRTGWELLNGMGFDYQVIWHDHLSEEYNEYEKDPDTWLQNWEPDPPNGFTLISTYDSENGPVAVFVKPQTEFAERLLRLGREHLQQNQSNQVQVPPVPINRKNTKGSTMYIVISIPLNPQPTYEGHNVFIYHPYVDESEPYSGIYLGAENLKIQLEENLTPPLGEVDETLTINLTQYTITRLAVEVTQKDGDFIWYWLYMLEKPAP